VVEEDLDHDDIMLMDDIIDSYSETSSASDFDQNEPYDHNDDEFFDDITVESENDSASGGEMVLNNERPRCHYPDSQKVEYSDVIPEECQDDLEDHEYEPGSHRRRTYASQEQFIGQS
jgi:hypothetical protein